MATIVREHTYVDGKAAKPSEVNADLDVLYTEINGNLDWDNLEAALVNAADGIVKLDGDSKVPAAQMAAVIDADTVDTKHYSDIVDKIAADIVIHAALADVHHTPVSSLAHASLTGVGASDHHEKTTTLTHSAITGVGASDHHVKTTALADITPDYDSGWVSVGNGVTYTFTHSLNTWSLLPVIKMRTGSGYPHTLFGSNVAVDAWFDSADVLKVSNSWADKQIRVQLWKF